MIVTDRWFYRYFRTFLTVIIVIFIDLDHEETNDHNALQSLYINDLIRIKFGPFILDNLKRGEILQVEEKKLSLFIKNKGIFW